MPITEKIHQAIEAVIAERTATLAAIHNKSVQLDNRAEEITDAAIGRDLTPQEAAELKDLDALMAQLSATHKRVIVLTHLKLTNLAAVQDLKQQIQSTNSALQAKFDQVKKVSENIKKIGAVAESLDKLVTSIGKLIPLF